MTFCTIIQARMGSTRLPGKVLLKVGGKTILEHVLGRIALCPAATGTVIVATGSHGGDNQIEDLCREIDVHCYRSSEVDVLHRYRQAGVAFGATRILRVTADMPLMCPDLTAEILEWPIGEVGDDYATVWDVPLGLSPELITADALERCWRRATDPDDREHVTLYALNHPGAFALAMLEPPDFLYDRKHWRLTLDTPADLELLERLFALTEGSLFGLATDEIVAAVDADKASLELATRPG